MKKNSNLIFILPMFMPFCLLIFSFLAPATVFSSEDVYLPMPEKIVESNSLCQARMLTLSKMLIEQNRKSRDLAYNTLFQQNNLPLFLFGLKYLKSSLSCPCNGKYSLSSGRAMRYAKVMCSLHKNGENKECDKNRFAVLCACKMFEMDNYPEIENFEDFEILPENQKSQIDSFAQCPLTGEYYKASLNYGIFWEIKCRIHGQLIK